MDQDHLYIPFERLPPFPKDFLFSLYERMVLIREFEE
jgi:hypothetical protein